MNTASVLYCCWFGTTTYNELPTYDAAANQKFIKLFFILFFLMPNRPSQQRHPSMQSLLSIEQAGTKSFVVHISIPLFGPIHAFVTSNTLKCEKNTLPSHNLDGIKKISHQARAG